jgi:hypothetical protein
MRLKSISIALLCAQRLAGVWRLDIRDTRITWMGSIPHSRQSQVDA